MKNLQPIQKVQEIQISYKHDENDKHLPILNNSKEAYNTLISHFNPDTIALQEQFLVLYLARNNKIKGIYSGFVGGITGTVADLRIILAIALKSASSSIILAHNHPSANMKPSEADKSLTNSIKHACKLMEIELLDHLIVGPEGSYFSFAEEGIL